LQDDRYEEHILPLMCHSCDVTTLSWTLSQFQMVDLREDFAASCQRLLRVWSLELRPDIAL